jgi:hypothetical protein
MRNRWAVVALAGLTTLAVMIDAASDRGAADNPFGNPNAEPAPFNPQMSALMSMLIQPRHAKLWLAGKAEKARQLRAQGTAAGPSGRLACGSPLEGIAGTRFG